MNQDEVYLRNLTEINFSLNEMKVLSLDVNEKIGSIDEIISQEISKSWTKVLEKKDLKIICQADKEILTVIEDVRLKTKQNSEAILVFNELFIKTTENIFKKLNEIQVSDAGMQKDTNNVPHQMKTLIPELTGRDEQDAAKKNSYPCKSTFLFAFSSGALLSILVAYIIN